MATRKPKPLSKGSWEEMRMFDIESIPTEQQTKVLELEEWWMTEAAQEAANTIVKAVEYGSASLESVGQALLSIAPQLQGKVSAQELAVTFYVFGKMARIIAALERGDLPGDDNWLDIGVYTKMVTYIRQNGEWV